MTPTTVLVLAVLAGLVLAGARFSFRRKALPAPLQPLFDTGTVFILVGMLLGPSGANLLDADMLQELSPVILIGLGWIGFLYGSHFSWRLLRRYPLGFYLAAVAGALLTAALVAGGAWLVLTYWLGPEFPALQRLWAALILGICASGTAPAGVYHLRGRRTVSNQDLGALRFLSAVDDLPAIVLLGLATALLQPGVPEALTGALSDLPAWLAAVPWLWLLFSVLLGLALGWAAHLLHDTWRDARQISLVLLGIVALGAGAADLMRLSPLFVTALAGLTFANLSRGKERAYGLLADAEHALYTVFLLVAGLLFHFDAAALAVLVPAYLVLRGAGKLGGGWVGRVAFLRGTSISPLIGAGMLYQGGMALAMAVSFQHAHAGSLQAQAATTVLLGVIVFELAAPYVTALVLGRRRRT